MSPGLYFLGLPWQHTRGSALLGWVEDDAEFIAGRIDAHAPQPARTPAPEPAASHDGGVTMSEQHSSAFPTDPAGLPEARRARDGRPRRRRVVRAPDRARSPSGSATTTVRMLAYNGSIPGPTLRVRAGLGGRRRRRRTRATWRPPSTGTACGSTTATTAPTRRRPRSRVGGSFTYRLAFPDPGVYWYHPHIREDYGQEMGLYGNVLVVPADPDYWPPAHRELVITLDDILLEDGAVAPFSRDGRRRTRRWAASATCCWSPARPSSRFDARRGRGRAPLPDQHRQHPRLQRRAARGAG